MRVTHQQTTAIILGSMNRNGSAMARLHEQLSNGLRIQRPSDDPVASVRLLRLQREEAALGQYGKNIGNLASSLAGQESGLRSASSALLNARELVLWASNGTHSAEDLRAMASELKGLEGTLAGLFNSRDEEGRYRYSGTQSDRPALVFDAATGRYDFGGNDQHRQVAVANGVMVDENITLHDVLGADPDLLNELHELVAMLEDPALDPSDPAVLAKLSGLLGLVDSAHSTTLGSITDLGGRQNNLTLVGEGNEDASIVNQTLENQLKSLDVASAMLALNMHEVSMSSTQKTYLKINSLSLFNLM
jgi:flagellar hook-associated protein 3 FlgL